MPFGTLNHTTQGVPIFAPPYQNGDHSFYGVTVVGIKYRVAAAQIQHLIPDVLELGEEPVVTSLFLTYDESTVGQYSEFVQQVEVTYQGEKFDYHIILFVDNESAIFSGRELYGYPKVFGKAEIQETTGGRLVLGNAQRPIGRPIVEFEFIPEQRVPSIPNSSQWGLNFRSIPPSVKTGGASIKELVPVFGDLKIGPAWLGKGSINFLRKSVLDPWGNFEILRYEGAYMAKNVTFKVLLRESNFSL